MKKAHMLLRTRSCRLDAMKPLSLAASKKHSVQGLVPWSATCVRAAGHLAHKALRGSAGRVRGATPGSFYKASNRGVTREARMGGRPKIWPDESARPTPFEAVRARRGGRWAESARDREIRLKAPNDDRSMPSSARPDAARLWGDPLRTSQPSSRRPRPPPSSTL